MNKRLPRYFECGGCGSWHPYGWGGDCRDDSMRFTEEELEEKHGGQHGITWIEVCELCGDSGHVHEEHEQYRSG